MMDLNRWSYEADWTPAGSYPVPVRRSWNSTCNKGRKALQQKGQLVFRLESSAVQPAIISSSYTRASHERHWEQLDISTWQERQVSDQSGVISGPAKKSTAAAGVRGSDLQSAVLVNAGGGGVKRGALLGVRTPARSSWSRI